MIGCRGCGELTLDRVLDLGRVPAADHFPLASEPVQAAEVSHGLAMDLCRTCGLAQLADDDTVADEPRGVEPQALRDQAVAAVELAAAAGWLQGDTVREFGSPHGGTWIPLLAERGFTSASSSADLVLDCFGVMHEPDQRQAFARRGRATGPNGVMLLQYHSITAILAEGQWNALRHGHFAYYSLTTLTKLLAAAGMSAVSAWNFGLYGGTVMIAAVHGDAAPDESVLRILATERELGITSADALSALQDRADHDAGSLRRWLEAEADAGKTVLGYGAASRAVAMFSRAGINSQLVAAVADASPAKQGRRMPGTDIPIVSPDDLLDAMPDRVLLTLPDLLPEVSLRYPELDGRWRTGPDHGVSRVEDGGRKSA